MRRLTTFRQSLFLAALAAVSAAPALAVDRPDRPYPPAWAYTTDGAGTVDREETAYSGTHVAATVLCWFGPPDDRIQVVAELNAPDSQIWKSNVLKFKQGANLQVSVLHTGSTIFWRADDVIVPFCKASLGVADKDKNLSFYDAKDSLSFSLECDGDLPTAMGLTDTQKADFLAKTGGSTSAECKGKIVGDVSAGCFRGDTVVATEHGLRAIREIAVGDRVWSWDEAAKKKVLSKVTETFVLPANGLRLVRAGEELLRTTDEHPFWVEGKGWTRAADLSVGARLRSEGGEILAVASNVRADSETFYAGYAAPLPKAVGFTPASVNLAPKNGNDVVHNIRVDGTHNYFVGKNEVLVHNK